MQVATVLFHYQTDDLTFSVFRQLHGLDNLYIHDDGSDVPYVQDETFEDAVTVKQYKYFRYIRRKERIGYVQSVNWMVDFLSRLPYDAVWLLNTDITGASMGVLDGLKNKLGSDPSIAAISTAIDPSPHSSMFAQQVPERIVGHIDFVCPLVNIRAWRSVGGFDENLKGYGCDLDWCYRARKDGWKFMVIPHIVVHHEMGGTCKRIADTKGHDDLEFMSSYLQSKWGVSNWSELTFD